MSCSDAVVVEMDAFRKKKNEKEKPKKGLKRVFTRKSGVSGSVLLLVARNLLNWLLSR
jgi:hypothetical protein